MTHTLVRLVVIVVVAALVAGCAAGRAFGRGESAARAGDWDSAVEHYRRAVQADPGNPEYKIALQRAMISASIQHLDQARVAEARGQLEEALREYRRASEFDPPNRQVAAKVLELERSIRDQIEATRQRPSAQQLREATRADAAQTLFNLNTVVQPILFQQASLRDILNFIGEAVGINVTYDSAYQDRVYSIKAEGVTLDQALTQIVTANQLFYKVMNPKTIMIIPDNQQKRAQYEEQVLVTFPLSYVDANEVVQTINSVVRTVGGQLAPAVAPNKTSNSVTVRATTAMMDVIERLVVSLDKPPAEVIVDVQILEVSRSRTRQFGLDLGSYAINAVFSPEADPRGAATGDGAGAGATDTTLTPRPFNANTISRGISTNDFYLAVPAAVIRFLETDSETRVIAKPQLRGATGAELKLNLGEDIPVPSTTFTPLAQGGANFNPLTSFTYRPVGVTVEMTPRVSLEGDVQLDLVVESSTLGAGITIAGQDLPSFGSRRVETKLRLREGEATLLAGLLQESQRKMLTGLPWVLNLPVIRQLFSSNDNNIQQTDIIMLLTPRIVRTQEYGPEDLARIHIGSQANLGVTGPPSLIAPTDAAPAGAPDAVPSPEAPAAPPPPAAAPGVAPGAAVPGPAPGAGQVLMSVPGPEFRLGGGPYLVPVSITGASQLSGITVTVTYNPAVLRLVSVQEGSFMRAGGVNASFSQQSDPASGRVDIAIVRSGDLTGVAGTGLLAGLLFEPVGSGQGNLALTGSTTGPGGNPVVIQFLPVAPVRVP
jgi:type II secretory pathway component GspD/PulD (secretin)